MGRAHKKMSSLQGAKCSNCEQPVLPHQICEACGYYKGKQAIRTKAELASKRVAKKKAREDKMKTKK